MRVFIIAQNSRFNTEPAEKYGSRVYLFDKEPSPFDTDKFYRDILRGLQNLEFDPEIDFIALTGSHIQVALFIAFVSNEYGEESINVLIFDARSEEYAHRKLPARVIREVA